MLDFEGPTIALKFGSVHEAFDASRPQRTFLGVGVAGIETRAEAEENTSSGCPHYPTPNVPPPTQQDNSIVGSIRWLRLSHSLSIPSHFELVLEPDLNLT